MQDLNFVTCPEKLTDTCSWGAQVSLRQAAAHPEVLKRIELKLARHAPRHGRARTHTHTHTTTNSARGNRAHTRGESAHKLLCGRSRRGVDGRRAGAYFPPQQPPPPPALGAGSLVTTIASPGPTPPPAGASPPAIVFFAKSLYISAKAGARAHTRADTAAKKYGRAAARDTRGARAHPSECA
jgi:hypothetical protein